MVNTYKDPLFIQWNKDAQGNKVPIQRLNEQYVIAGQRITLREIPDEFNGVEIDEMIEMTGIDRNKPVTQTDRFKVDYALGVLTFHEDLEGQPITINKYYGRGAIYYPASRIYTDINGEQVTQTLQTILDTHVKNFIFSTQEPPVDTTGIPDGSVWFVYEDE